MKKLVIAFALFATLGLSACGSSDDGGGGGETTASTPQPCSGENGSCGTPQPNTNQQYSNWCGYRANNGQWIPTNNCSYNNWQFIPQQQYNPYIGSCGCPAGTFPAYGGYGYACVPSQAYQGYNFWYVGFNFNPNYYQGYAYWRYSQNYSWLNNFQHNYSSNYGQTTYSSCQNQIAQGCDVRLNNCPSGSRCQPAGGGSTIGLCVR